MSDKAAVTITPYVAASIIEHGKRRHSAAGFIFGDRTGNVIAITDFVPMTHIADIKEIDHKSYKEDRISRITNKRAFTSDAYIGWYSVVSAPTEDADAPWCTMPGQIALEPNEFNIHLHCALLASDKEGGSVAIRWSALKRRKVGDTLEKVPLDLNIAPGTDDRVSKVVVNYAQSEVLYGGAQPYESHPLLDLDTAAFLARKAALEPQVGSAAAEAGEHGTRKNPSSAVNAVLTEAYKSLRAAVERAQGDASSPDSKEMLEAIQVLHEARANVQDRQQANVASREDYATEKFKNALMIKCMAAQLRLQTKQILELASKYPPKKVEE